jgi:hypothetical protein
MYFKVEVQFVVVIEFFLSVELVRPLFVHQYQSSGYFGLDTIFLEASVSSQREALFFTRGARTETIGKIFSINHEIQKEKHFSSK